MYGIKTEDDYEGFSSDKEMFGFSNYSIKSKRCNHSNELFTVKLKDKATDVVIEGFVGLQLWRYFLW